MGWRGPGGGGDQGMEGTRGVEGTRGWRGPGNSGPDQIVEIIHANFTIFFSELGSECY